jgi:type II secretory pathway pseudopilin PulG
MLHKNYLLKKERAFTLAEALITLGIIGVVATLTIPNLIASYQEKVTVNKVKKMYSMLSQALKLAITENGNVDEWDYIAEQSEAGAKSFAEYIKPYMKIAVDCGTKTTGVCNTGNTYVLNGDTWNCYNSTTYYKFILNDGSKLWFRLNGTGACTVSDGETKNVCALVWYDTDGTKSKNIIGKDIFVFFVMSDRIMPHPNDDCRLSDWGFGCTSYILKNGNTKYLKK